MILVRNIARWLVGLLFLFSGFVKLVDPIGTAIKMEEYFLVFRDYSLLSWAEALTPYALFLAVLMIVLEIVLGVSLLCLFRIRTTAWLLLLIILYFTALTGFSAFTGKVTDCGCFGDAMPLTPHQSFYKDLVLLVLIGIIFWQRGKFRSVLNNWAGVGLVASSTVLSLLVAMHALSHLPPIDFRPYKVGTDLKAAMTEIPAERELYYTLKDLNSGEELVVSNSDYMETESYWDPKAYEMLSDKTEEKILKPGKPATITEYQLMDTSATLQNDRILTGSDLVIYLQNVNKTNRDHLPQITALVNTLSADSSIQITFASASLYKDFAAAFPELASFGLFCNLDETVSKAVIRANPGLMLLKEGVVLEKWHHNDTPTAQEINDLLAR